ncbi:MAG: tetratricopeptide repeat protein [Candidatus Binatia bacterium]|nr:tetratricopeptide repeat protein [Candidatus Binatia bacterium]
MAGILYAPTLGYELVWDDPISVHRWLPALDSVTAVFFPPAHIPQFPPDYYRPLQLLSYKLDRAIGGGGAWAFHLSSVLWHVAATTLVYIVGLSLWRGEPFAARASFVAALLFAVHPIHTESVAWMAARPDPMVATFMLTALCLVLSPRPLPFVGAAAVAALVLAALLSKENAVAAICLLPLAAWWRGRDSRLPQQGHRKVLQTSTAVLAASLAYAVLRVFGLANYRLLTPEVSLPPPVLFPAALGWYSWKVLCPFPQNAFVAEVPQHATYPALALVGLAATFALMRAALHWRREYWLFCAAWFWLTLLPSLALLLSSSNAQLAERYLYVPSVAFSWLVGEGIVRLAQGLSGITRTAFVALVVAVFASFAVTTVSRSRVWQNDVALWQDTSAKNPKEGFPLRNLAAALLERGHHAEAEKMLLQALERRNSPAGLYGIFSNLGTVAFLRHDYGAAGEYYRKAYAQQPTADAAYNLGAAILKSAEALPDAARRGQLLEAQSWFGRALALSPYDPEVHFGYGQVAALLGDRESARRHFQRALELGIRDPQAQHARGFLAESTR